MAQKPDDLDDKTLITAFRSPPFAIGPVRTDEAEIIAGCTAEARSPRAQAWPPRRFAFDQAALRVAASPFITFGLSLRILPLRE